MKKVLFGACFFVCAAVFTAADNTGRVLASETNGQIRNAYDLTGFQVLSLLQEEKVELNIRNFKDPAVLDMARKYDHDGDGALDQEERDSVTSAGLSGQGIQDPSGLYYFRRIRWMNLNENRIRKIELKHFPELEVLYINNNELESLDGNFNTQLQEVTLLGNYNLQGTLSFVNSPDLRLLHCGDTGLEKINLSENGALEAFSASHTPSLRTIVYPEIQKSAKPLSVSPKDLYAQDFGEKGKHIQWRIYGNGTDGELLQENADSVKSYGLTLKSTWEANEYTIEYQMPKEASFKEPENVITQGKAAEKIQLPDVQIKEGYHFVKWTSSKGTIQKNEFQYAPDGKKETVKLTYVVEKDQPVIPERIKVNFQPGADHVQGTMESMEADNGKRFYFPKNRYQREGYSFRGWKLINGTTVYPQGGSIYVSGRTQDLEVTAVWEKIKGVLVIGQKEKEIVQQHVLSEEDLETPEKEGYEFRRWELDGKTVQSGDMVKVTSQGERIRILPVYEERISEAEEKIPEAAQESAAEETAPADSEAATEKEPVVQENAVRKKMTKVSVAKISQQVYQNRPAAVKPVLKDGKYILKEGKDYRTIYYNHKGPGTAKIKFTGIGQYTGSLERSFVIVPKAPSLKAQAGRKSITVSSSSAKVSGYQISYSLSRNKNFRTVTTGKKYKIKNLKSKKTYYIKVRAYKTVQGRKIYSSYSKLIKIRVK